MVRIFAIFEMTVKKVKEPAFSLLFVIAAVIGYCVSGMGAMALSNNDGLLYGLISLEKGQPLYEGSVVIMFMTMIIAIFAGATDIPKDIDSRMIMLVLGKPIHRIEYLLGKYLGIIAICFIFFITAGVVAIAVNLGTTGQLMPAKVIVRQLLLMLAVFPFAAMTMMISCFLSDIGAMIVASVYLILSVFFSSISMFVDMLPRSLSVVSAVHFVAYLFPNYFYFFNAFKFVGVVIVALTLYSASMTIIFLAIALSIVSDQYGLTESEMVTVSCAIHVAHRDG